MTRRAALGGLAGATLVSSASGSSSLGINVARATLRPAMRGIFSGRGNQRDALIALINEAAAGGKTIEWGPLDVSLDVVTNANRGRGLQVPSGSRWIMHPNTRFRALPNDAEHYAIVDISNAHDIVIAGGGARLTGERHEHRGSAGEWGHGLNIVGSDNVHVSDLVIEDCWGDGVYVGATAARGCSADVTLERIVANNNRRQGLSIVSARRLRCRDSRFLDTGGTNPQAGIDIEPNSPDDCLEGIEIVRPLPRNNGGPGISVYLARLEGSATPVGILIDGLRDEGSEVGFSVAYPAATPLGGRVRFERPFCRNSRESAMRSRAHAAIGPEVIVDDPVFEDWNRTGLDSPTYASAVSIFAERKDRGTGAIGNIVVNRPRYRLGSGVGHAALFVRDFRPGADAPTGIELDHPQAMPPLLPYRVGGAADVRILDTAGVSSRTLAAASQVLAANDWYSRFVTPTLAQPITLTIDGSHPVGLETEIVVGGTDGFAVTVAFAPGLSLLPDAPGAGRKIAATGRGSRLRIRKTSAATWQVLEKAGTWSTS
jgi:hypothetical protein